MLGMWIKVNNQEENNWFEFKDFIVRKGSPYEGYWILSSYYSPIYIKEEEIDSFFSQTDPLA